MNKALDKYENDDSVVAVTGYSYPCNYVHSENSTIIKENFFCPMWGTGFWKNTYYDLRRQLCEEYVLHYDFNKNLKLKLYRNLIDARFINFVYGGLSWQANIYEFLFSDISVSTFIGLYNKYVIYPVQSMVRNNGFDGTGVTCPKINNDIFSSQKINIKKSFKIIEDTLNSINANCNIVNKFDSRTKKQKSKAWFKIALYKILGKNYINGYGLNVMVNMINL